jgi:hypothetical protein
MRNECLITSKVPPVVPLQGGTQNHYRGSWFPAIADRFDRDRSDNPVPPRLRPISPKLRSFRVAFCFPWVRMALRTLPLRACIARSAKV